MEEGFIPDLGYGANRLSDWYAGKPEYGIFGNLILLGYVFGEKKTAIPISTYRCPECGFLRSYALKTSD